MDSNEVAGLAEDGDVQTSIRARGTEFPYQKAGYMGATFPSLSKGFSLALQEYESLGYRTSDQVHAGVHLGTGGGMVNKEFSSSLKILKTRFFKAWQDLPSGILEHGFFFRTSVAYLFTRNCPRNMVHITFATGSGMING